MIAKTEYELLDHTADCGVRVFSRTLEGLFENAALTLVDLIVPSAALSPNQEHRLAISGMDTEDLLVNWLREILYLFSGMEELAASISIEKLDDRSLIAIVRTENFSPQKHEIDQDIKAVTYHQSKINRTSEGWECTVIFDV